MDIKLGRILPILLLLISGISYGQDLKDTNGDLLAHIDTSTGILTNVNNIQMGQFMPNGEIKDGVGEIMGRIEQGEFKNTYDQVLGSINPGGIVFDSDVPTKHPKGKIQGTEVLDMNNDLIGKISYASNPKWIAAYYFFFFPAVF